MKSDTPGGRDGLGPKHGGRGLLGRANGSVLDVERVAIHRGAVGVVTFDENQSEGRGCHRQAEYRVHMHPFGPTRWSRARAAHEHTGRCRGSVASTFFGDTTRQSCGGLAGGGQPPVTAAAVSQGDCDGIVGAYGGLVYLSTVLGGWSPPRRVSSLAA